MKEMQFADKLKDMNLAELRELGAQVEKELVKAERREIDQAVNDILRIAHGLNMPLKTLLERGGLMRELTGKGTDKAPAARAPSTSLYVHPIDPTLSWRGRGKHPQWIKQLIGPEGGYTLEQLRVSS
jgi:DNA-binding protein H-NS